MLTQDEYEKLQALIFDHKMNLLGKDDVDYFQKNKWPDEALVIAVELSAIKTIEFLSDIRTDEEARHILFHGKPDAEDEQKNLPLKAAIKTQNLDCIKVIFDLAPDKNLLITELMNYDSDAFLKNERTDIFDWINEKISESQDPKHPKMSREISDSREITKTMWDQLKLEERDSLFQTAVLKGIYGDEKDRDENIKKISDLLEFNSKQEERDRMIHFKDNDLFTQALKEKNHVMFDFLYKSSGDESEKLRVNSLRMIDKIDQAKATIKKDLSELDGIRHGLSVAKNSSDLLKAFAGLSGSRSVESSSSNPENPSGSPQMQSTSALKSESNDRSQK